MKREYVLTFESFNDSLNESAIDKIPKDKHSDLLKKLNQLVKRFDDRGYVKELYDPQQTHGVYGASSSLHDEIRNDLISKGAKKFRVVKNKLAPDIICFDGSSMKI